MYKYLICWSRNLKVQLNSQAYTRDRTFSLMGCDAPAGTKIIKLLLREWKMFTSRRKEHEIIQNGYKYKDTAVMKSLFEDGEIIKGASLFKHYHQELVCCPYH